MLSTKQGSHWYHFNAFCMVWPGFEPTTSRSRSGCSTTEPPGPVSMDASFYRILPSEVFFLTMGPQLYNTNNTMKGKYRECQTYNSPSTPKTERERERMNSNDRLKETLASRPRIIAAKIGFSSHQGSQNHNVTYVRIKMLFVFKTERRTNMDVFRYEGGQHKRSLKKKINKSKPLSRILIGGGGNGGDRILRPTNSLGQMETGPRFKVLSKRLQNPRSNSRTLVYKASSFTTAPRRHLH